jgi:Ni/Co efflux regulator RcnB
MKIYWPAILAAAVALALSGCSQSGAGDAQSAAPQADSQQQVASEWYNQHQNNLPEGLRPEDRLSAEQESRLRVGATLDNDLRDKVRPAPADLAAHLAPPPPDHRYVAVGGHVGLIDKNFQVKAVINVGK